MIRATGAGLLCALALGCGGESDLTGPGTTVRIQPTPAVMQQLGTVQLHAELLDAEGHTIPGAAFAYSSSRTDLVTINASGLASSVGPHGQAVITATAGGISGQVSIAIIQVSASIEILPDPIVLPPGKSMPVAARVLDAVGEPMSGSITFSADPASLLAVTQHGQLVAVGGPGSGALTASVGSLSETVPVSVQPVTTLTGNLVGTAAINTTPYAAVLGPGGAVYGLGIGGSLNIGQYGSTQMQAESFSGSNTIGIVRHPDSGLLYVAGSEADALMEVNPASRSVLRRWAAPGVQMYDAALSPDRTRIYVAGIGGTLNIIDIATMTRVAEFHTATAIVHLTPHPSRPIVYASGLDAVREIDLESGAIRTFFHGVPQAAALLLAGDRLVIGSENGNVRVVTLASGAASTVAVDCRIYDLVAAPDGATLVASCPTDNKAVILDADTFEILATIPTGGDPRRIAISADGASAVIANSNGWYDFLE